MVTACFPGVEHTQTPPQGETEGNNSSSEAQDEVVSSVREASLSHKIDIENWERVAGFGVGITSLLIEDFLTHPFIVVRRQCMVNSSARLYHLTPFSVAHIMIELKRKQGLSTFWKGQGSRLAVRGINLLTELVISDVASNQLPSDTKQTSSSTVKEFTGHVVGKILSIILALPFYSASIAETVQTEQIEIHSGPLSFIKEGLLRLVGWQGSAKGHGRLLPLWSLILPTVLHSLLHYLMQTCLQHLILVGWKKRGILNTETRRQDEPEEVETNARNMMATYFPELLASLTSSVLTDIAMYPLETVLYRLHLQGTRTMLDDTDNGYAVVSLCTNYDGFFDCFTRVRVEEGVFGFYKGFGALLLQYIIQLAVLRFTKTVYLALSEDFRGDQGADKTE